MTLRDQIHAEISCACPLDLAYDDPTELLDDIMAAIDRDDENRREAIQSAHREAIAIWLEHWSGPQAPDELAHRLRQCSLRVLFGIP